MGACTLPSPPVPAGAAELKQLYLLKPWHGSGVAHALMEWAIAEARESGAAHMALSVYSDNHRARRFYARYGLVEIGANVFMVGATAIESASRAKISARSAVELINGAYALHPAFGEAEVVETCAEVRPSFSDNLPRVVRDGRVVRVNGLYRNGFLLSPTFGRLAADAVFELENGREADRQRLAS